jgi:hypothetical protein
MREQQYQYDTCPYSRMNNGPFAESRLFLPMPKFKKREALTFRKRGRSPVKKGEFYESSGFVEILFFF